MLGTRAVDDEHGWPPQGVGDTRSVDGRVGMCVFSRHKYGQTTVR